VLRSAEHRSSHVEKVKQVLIKLHGTRDNVGNKSPLSPTFFSLTTIFLYCLTPSRNRISCVTFDEKHFIAYTLAPCFCLLGEE
jgi:hypothetical protein